MGEKRFEYFLSSKACDCWRTVVACMKGGGDVKGGYNFYVQQPSQIIILPPPPQSEPPHCETQRSIVVESLGLIFGGPGFKSLLWPEAYWVILCLSL